MFLYNRGVCCDWNLLAAGLFFSPFVRREFSEKLVMPEELTRIFSLEKNAVQ